MDDLEIERCKKSSFAKKKKKKKIHLPQIDTFFGTKIAAASYNHGLKTQEKGSVMDFYKILGKEGVHDLVKLQGGMPLFWFRCIFMN